MLVASEMAGAATFTIDSPMDEAAARAMLNRFGYGATPASLARATRQTPRQYLQQAITDTSRLPAVVTEQILALPTGEALETVWERLGPGGSARTDGANEDAKKERQRAENQFASAAVQGRLLSMANGDNSGHEALLSFWLNHFSIYAPKNLTKLLAWDYIGALNEAIREDSFEALLRASFFHPAMQVYLDNAQSTATTSIAGERASERGKTVGINENLARELLELYTLGVDSGYSLKDVQELARIITGAGVFAPNMREAALRKAGAIRQGLFLFDPRRHDFGEKTFLGQAFPAGNGLTEIDRALHLMAIHPATGKRIAQKLAQRFLADDPPPQIVDAMADGFRRSGGKISATLIPLLSSRAFAASLEHPTKFKEPLDYILSVARAACGNSPVGNRLILAASATDMGQAPLLHTTPDGFGNRESDWLSPAAMAKRVRLAMGVANEKVPLAQAADDRIGPLKKLEDGARGLMRGQACNIDSATLEQAVGPVSGQTRASLAALSPTERNALLLASPEFMRR